MLRKAMPRLLRSFLYLDDRLTEQYLAQLEGGIYDVEQQAESGTRERGVHLGAKAGPVSSGASWGRDAKSETSRTVRQTPESAYGRLERLLEDQDQIQDLESVDSSIWGQLTPGDVLRVRSTVKVPSFFIATEMAGNVAPLLDVMGMVGEVSDDERAAISGMTTLGQTAGLSVVAHLAGSPRFKLVCRLHRDFLRADLSELAGECTVVGVLDRHLRTGENYSIMDDLKLGGAQALPRDERRKMQRGMKRDMRDSVVSAPAALVTPVAFFR